jgi:hypothetical protein
MLSIDMKKALQPERLARATNGSRLAREGQQEEASRRPAGEGQQEKANRRRLAGAGLARSRSSQKKV